MNTKENCGRGFKWTLWGDVPLLWVFPACHSPGVSVLLLHVLFISCIHIKSVHNL